MNKERNTREPQELVHAVFRWPAWGVQHRNVRNVKQFPLYEICNMMLPDLNAIRCQACKILLFCSYACVVNKNELSLFSEPFFSDVEQTPPAVETRERERERIPQLF
jgi:hypothetical protein